MYQLNKTQFPFLTHTFYVPNALLTHLIPYRHLLVDHSQIGLGAHKISFHILYLQRPCLATTCTIQLVLPASLSTHFTTFNLFYHFQLVLPLSTHFTSFTTFNSFYHFRLVLPVLPLSTRFTTFNSFQIFTVFQGLKCYCFVFSFICHVWGHLWV
jgi:hypothetical protein